MQNLTEKFHFIHLSEGDEPLAAQSRAFIESFRDHHPAAEITVWTYGKLQSEGHQLPAAFYAESDPRAKADVLRYWILANFGGIYCDLDVVCLQPWTSWCSGKSAFVAQYRAGRVGVTNGVMGALPGSAFFGALLEMLPGAAIIYRNATYLERVGSHLMDKLLLGGDFPEVVKAEPELFCPLTLAERAASVIPDLAELCAAGSLGVHLWATAGDEPRLTANYAALGQRMLNALGWPNAVFGAQADLPQRQYAPEWYAADNEGRSA